MEAMRHGALPLRPGAPLASRDPQGCEQARFGAKDKERGGPSGPRHEVDQRVPGGSPRRGSTQGSGPASFISGGRRAGAGRSIEWIPSSAIGMRAVASVGRRLVGRRDRRTPAGSPSEPRPHRARSHSETPRCLEARESVPRVREVPREPVRPEVHSELRSLVRRAWCAPCFATVRENVEPKKRESSLGSKGRLRAVSAALGKAVGPAWRWRGAPVGVPGRRPGSLEAGGASGRPGDGGGSVCSGARTGRRRGSLGDRAERLRRALQAEGMLPPVRGRARPQAVLGLFAVLVDRGGRLHERSWSDAAGPERENASTGSDPGLAFFVNGSRVAWRGGRGVWEDPRPTKRDRSSGRRRSAGRSGPPAPARRRHPPSPRTRS